jgi:hypothetical protein
VIGVNMGSLVDSQLGDDGLDRGRASQLDGLDGHAFGPRISWFAWWIAVFAQTPPGCGRVAAVLTSMPL